MAARLVAPASWNASGMRVCVVYDCLYPHTVGGAERWYRDLAERLAAEGHEVTYVTLRQWPRGERAQIDPRVRVVTAGPRMALYTASGRRRTLPPLVFGARRARAPAASRALLRRRAHVLVPVLLTACGRRGASLEPFKLVVDWFEVWSDSYWRDYLGAVGGRVGALVQRLCARVPSARSASRSCTRRACTRRACGGR